MVLLLESLFPAGLPTKSQFVKDGLVAACTFGHQDVAEHVLGVFPCETTGLGPIIQTDLDSPFCAACSGGHSGIVDLILGRLKVDVWSGLIAASKGGHLEIVAKLLPLLSQVAKYFQEGRSRWLARQETRR